MADDRQLTTPKTIEVRGDRVENFPLHCPPPLPPAVRAILAEPDSVEVCLIVGNPRESVGSSVDTLADKIAAGYPARSSWVRLSESNAQAIGELLLSAEEFGRRGVYSCIYHPLEVFRFVRDRDAVTVRVCHCTKNATLQLGESEYRLFVEGIELGLLEVVAQVFPHDERVASKLASVREHPFEPR